VDYDSLKRVALSQNYPTIAPNPGIASPVRNEARYIGPAISTVVSRMAQP